MRLSKLNHMALGLAVYASPPTLPLSTKDSLLDVGQALPDGIYTRRVTIKGFRFQFTSLPSSFPKLLGAIPFSLSRLRAGLMRGSLSPAALRCVLSAADASLALDRFGIMPARSRVDILSTRLVFAPTVHGSAWPAAFGIIKRTDRAKRLSTTLLLRDSAHYLATPKPCRATVEHNPIWQHRYGGVHGGSGTTVFTESLQKCGCPPSTPLREEPYELVYSRTDLCGGGWKQPFLPRSSSSPTSMAL